MGERVCEWCCERIWGEPHEEAEMAWHDYCVDDAREHGQIPTEDEDPHGWVEDSSWAEERA